jgi:hypothetical protein
MASNNSQPDTDVVEHATGLDWSPDIDRLLASWCDKAKCFEWMHAQAFSMFDQKSKSFMIAINTLTALSGLSNVIAGGYSVSGFQLAWVFGGISIVVSTLNILQDKLGYQASTHLHKKLSSDWGSIKGKIEEVVSIPYAGRKDCKTVMRYIKDDIAKAASDGNALIPQYIREACYDKFKNIPEFDIPDICGQVEHTKVYMNPIVETINIPPPPAHPLSAISAPSSLSV